MGGETSGLWASPLGAVVVTRAGLGITNICVARDDDLKRLSYVDSDLAEELDAHISNRPASLKVDLHKLSPFRQLATAMLLRIPHGEVRSYSWIAREIGKPNAVRAVASACSNNPVPLIVPCHRVVRSDGSIGEYSMGGSGAKEKMLANEGVDVARLQDLNARHVRFLGDPATNTFHVIACRHVVGVDNAIELKLPDDAIARHLTPCQRCFPIDHF